MAASDLIRISFDSTSGISVHLNPEVFFGSMALFGLALAVSSYHGKYFRSRAFEIESAEFGFGNGKISFKPNEVDQQIAYAIWVELSTRKIGLSIDPEKDVIYEVYDSWFSFFGITRELLKSLPVSKYRHDSTKKIVALSMQVLNDGLRPHLTTWQARFRRWYERQLSKEGEDSPQEIQRRFPQYAELTAELLEVNKHLMAYREKMHSLVVDS